MSFFCFFQTNQTIGCLKNFKIVVYLKLSKKENVSDSYYKSINMKSKATHVVPDPQGGWKIEEAGAKHSSSEAHFNTKKEAVSKAREISREEGSELVIHGRTGKIETKDSHGHDSRRVKG